MQQPSLLKNEYSAGFGIDINPLVLINVGVESCCTTEKQIPWLSGFQLICHSLLPVLGGIEAKYLGRVIEIKMHSIV